jgi:hypothetical protein
VLTPSTPFAFPQVGSRRFACFRVDPGAGTIAFPQLRAFLRDGGKGFRVPLAPLCDESSHGLHLSRVIGYRLLRPSAGAFLLVAPVVAVGVDVVAGDELVVGCGWATRGGQVSETERRLVYVPKKAVYQRYDFS